MTKADKHVAAMLVQKHQLDESENQISQLDAALAALQSHQSNNNDELDSMLANMEAILQNCGIAFNDTDDNVISREVANYVDINNDTTKTPLPRLTTIETLNFNQDMSWDAYSDSIQDYATQHHIDLSADPFKTLMSPLQRIELEKRIKEEFTLKTANCDKYDYMIAGTCGVIGGLIDVFFVGLPGEGKLTNLTDSAVDGAVEKFAGACGWEGAREGSDSTQSAIGFLERNFKVNYDHRHGGDVDGLFKMSTKNHHIKSLAHSPDLVGLFFSILGQFTNTAHFVSDGKIISIDTETAELQGGNFIAKIFSGFVNWLGHLFSDVAGSSGATGRGSGIPIPFYSLLQFINVGEFGQHRQTFATIAVKVFEKGYDFRHGLAMAIPVLVTELMTRITWVIKQRAYHKKPWTECIPTTNNPELRRMLLVSHGSLCLIDAGDAALCSGGDMVQFLLRTNILGWARFGTLAIKELNAWYNAGHIDSEAVDEYLEKEYRKLLILDGK